MLSGRMEDSQSTLGGGTKSNETASTEDLYQAQEHLDEPLGALKLSLYTPETSVSADTEKDSSLEASTSSTLLDTISTEVRGLYTYDVR